MSELRFFNEAGRGKWREWLETLTDNPANEFPVELLTNPDFTRRAPGSAKINEQLFETKFMLAETLAPAILSVRSARLPTEAWAGLWDWLAAFYFDSICPPQKSGRRKLNELVRYHFNPSWRRRYRHRVFGPVELFLRLGSYSKLLIHGEPGSLSDWEEQTASRYQISGNAGIAEALFRLYWDETKQAPKRSAATNSMKPGTLRRFGVLIQQFNRTFDLLSIEADAILDLLPKKEFSRFRS